MGAYTTFYKGLFSYVLIMAYIKNRCHPIFIIPCMPLPILAKVALMLVQRLLV